MFQKFLPSKNFLVTILFACCMIISNNSNAQAPYCNEDFANNAEPITRVNFGTINNITSATVGGNSYEDFTSITTNVTQASTHIIIVEGNSDGDFDNYYTVFFDWNHDNDFTDSDERFNIGIITNSTGTDGQAISSSVLIPNSALPGNTRMRVVKRYSTTSYPGTCNTSGYGQAEDYTVIVAAGVGCSGVPLAGTITAPATACENTPFTITNTGATSGVGIEYQYQGSHDNINFFQIFGPVTSSSATVSQSSPTYYRLRVRCTNSNDSALSNVVSVGMTPPTQCYCASAASSSGDEDIVNVTVGTLNNTSACAALAAGPGSIADKYSNYTTTVAAPNLPQGTAVNLGVSVQGCGGDGYSTGFKIYIDYNQNGSFADAGEEVFVSPLFTSSVSPIVSQTGSFTVPANALPGNTRMRIVAVETSDLADITPCSTTYGWGETEDYLVNILAGNNCNGTPIAGTSSATQTAICSPGNVTLSNSGSGSGIDLTYQWQSSPDNITFTDIFAATSTSYIANITATTWFKLIVKCPGSGISVSSNTVKITLSGIPANDECANAIPIPVTAYSAVCSGTLVSTVCATQSAQTTSCAPSSSDDDVWYSFVATSASHLIKYSNFTVVSGTASQMGYTIYTGTCGALVERGGGCTTGFGTAGAGEDSLSNLTVGQTYYLRAFTGGTDGRVTFNLCITDLPTNPTTCASYLAPANGATNVQGPVVNFNWTKVPNATSYVFYLSATGAPVIPTDSITTVTDTTVQIINLAYGTTYNWFVIPKNTGGANYGCTTPSTFTYYSPVAPVNDLCNNATALTIGNGFCTNPVLGTVAGADSTNGLTVSCTTPLKFDVWYTVNVQPGKKVIVQTSAINATVTDLVLQSYTGACGALINYKCDDDGNPESGPSSNHSRLLLTNTGGVDSLYFVRVMAYSGGHRGDFAICAWDTTAPGLPNVSTASAGTCTPAAGLTIDSLNANLYMWVPVRDGSGNIIAEIYPNGNILGAINTSLFRNTGAIRQFNAQYYLDRDVTIQVANQPSAASKVKLRLYFTNAELTALQTVVPGTTRGNLAATKENAACTASGYSATNPVFEGNSANSGYKSDHFIQLDTVASFSRFFIHRNIVNTPLPIAVEYLKAKKQGSANVLNWKASCNTASVKFEVMRSADGRNFNSINSFTATQARCAQPFDFTDANPLPATNYYRLRMTEADGNVSYSVIVAVINRETGFELISLMPTLVKDGRSVLSVTSASKQKMEVVITDVLGKVVFSKTASADAGSSTFELDIRNLAGGSYQVTIYTKEGRTRTLRFVKN